MNRLIGWIGLRYFDRKMKEVGMEGWKTYAAGLSKMAGGLAAMATGLTMLLNDIPSGNFDNTEAAFAAIGGGFAGFCWGLSTMGLGHKSDKLKAATEDQTKTLQAQNALIEKLIETTKQSGVK